MRQLVNHMTRGNLNYALLASGGSGSEFLPLRDRDALGGEPGLVAWIRAESPTIYAGLDVSSFFGVAAPVDSGNDQDRLVGCFGRTPGWRAPAEGDRI